MCLGTIGGYFLLGKGMSKKGLIVCGVIILAAVYLATRLNYSIELYRALDGSVSFGGCFSSVMKLLSAYGETGSFYKDLGIGYLITRAGGAGLMYKLGVFDE